MSNYRDHAIHPKSRRIEADEDGAALWAQPGSSVVAFEAMEPVTVTDLRRARTALTLIRAVLAGAAKGDRDTELLRNLVTYADAPNSGEFMFSVAEARKYLIGAAEKQDDDPEPWPSGQIPPDGDHWTDNPVRGATPINEDGNGPYRYQQEYQAAVNTLNRVTDAQINAASPAPSPPPAWDDSMVDAEGNVREPPAAGTEGRWRKKPVVVDAWCNTEDTPHRSAVPGWLNDAMNRGDVWLSGGPWHGPLSIRTLEGTMTADYGDWVIRGVAGELYPCKPDIFAATYEPAARPPSPSGRAATPEMVEAASKAVDEYWHGTYSGKGCTFEGSVEAAINAALVLLDAVRPKP